MRTPRLNAILNQLTGDPDRISLEHRLFNLMLFLIILIAIWGTSYNYSLDLPMYIVLPCALALGVAIFTYIVSRRRQQYSEQMIYPIILISTPILGFIFFLNSGSAGPMVIFILAFFHIFIILTNGRNQVAILIMLYAFVIVLYIAELLFPRLIMPYAGNASRFWDSLITFSVSSLMLAASTILFKRNYNNERKMLAHRNLELINRNATIREQKQLLEQKTGHLEAALAELQEKNDTIQTLMKELNHRVGNNLQLIYSLLNMQEAEIPDAKARQSISQAKNRIIAISILHQKLYSNEQSRDIDLPAYIRELCGYLVQDMTPAIDLKFSFSPPDFHSDLKASIHIGLIINEIVTNALKHAWLPEHTDRRLTLKARVEEDNRLEMSVADNGGGFSDSEPSPQDSRFGLHFVQSVLVQYAGDLKLNNNRGGVVEIALTLP